MADVEFTEASKQVSYGEELVAWGTAAATKNLWMGAVQRFSAPVTPTAIAYSAAGANGQNLGVAVTAHDIAGNLDMLIQHGKIFQYLAAETTTGTDPYTHVISRAQTGADAPTSLTFVETNVDPAAASHVTRQYTGVHLVSTSISFPTKDLIKATINFTSKKPTKLTSKESVTASTTSPFQTSQAVLSVDTGGGYSEESQVFNAVVDLNTGLMSDNHVFGSTDIVQQAHGVYNGTITFDKYFRNSDAFDAILADTETDVKILVTRAANDTFQIELKDCHYQEHRKSEGITEKQKESVKLVAKTWELTFVDSIASY